LKDILRTLISKYVFHKQIQITQIESVNLDEKISIFKTIGNTTYANGAFSLPAESGSSQASFTTVTELNIQAYPITTITANQLASGTTTVYLDGVASTAYSINGTTLTLNAAPAAGIDIFIVTTQDDFYRLGTVIYSEGALPTQELERVDRGELYHLLSSKLTAPTTTYPIYIYERQKLFVYPSTIQSGVQATYIRKPMDPVWNFTLSGNAYVYNPDTSINFELHDAEQTEIVLKVLLYAGVVVKDPTIIQVAAQQVAQEQQNQKS